MEILNRKIVRRYKCGYNIVEEDCISNPNDEPIRVKSAYTPNGDYIGDTKFAHFLCNKKGIKPEKRNPENCVCSIGYSEKEHKWYGWSHRGICGFGIGSVVEEGDCAYIPKLDELFENIAKENIEFDIREYKKSKTKDYILDIRIYPISYDEYKDFPIQFEKAQSKGKILVFNDKIIASEWKLEKDIKNNQVIYTEYSNSKDKEDSVSKYKAGRGKWKAKTLEDAKQIAIDFASSIS